MRIPKFVFLRFEVYKPTVEGKRYVVIRVLPFQTVPHVCGRSYGSTLEEAAIYIRGEGARTIKVQSAEQIRRLVDRATQVSADAIVNRIRELVLYSQKGLAEAPDKFEAQAKEVRKQLGGG